ncbi:MAG: hypothetical protein KIT02_09600 [Devosia sp.]|uniref:hypothetical protein n=1 Tax=Devosia sp. TaxID=1871048 RepID=UPI0024CB8DDB|nr:hypothetical protein [Devosia sp.]UYN98230.1 MAG: hypothetical protein KIT02_09600 [Devosia sp.]
MDWNLLGAAVLLALAGFYFMEGEMRRAPMEEVTARILKPARNALERAWLAEPVQVFMRQILSARHRRAGDWRVGRSQV